MNYILHAKRAEIISWGGGQKCPWTAQSRQILQVCTPQHKISLWWAWAELKYVTRWLLKNSYKRSKKAHDKSSLWFMWNLLSSFFEMWDGPSVELCNIIIAILFYSKICVPQKCHTTSAWCVILKLFWKNKHDTNMILWYFSRILFSKTKLLR